MLETIELKRQLNNIENNSYSCEFTLLSKVLAVIGIIAILPVILIAKIADLIYNVVHNIKSK